MWNTADEMQRGKRGSFCTFLTFSAKGLVGKGVSRCAKTCTDEVRFWLISRRMSVD
jgi:hypothetical protein